MDLQSLDITRRHGCFVGLLPLVFEEPDALLSATGIETIRWMLEDGADADAGLLADLSGGHPSVVEAVRRARADAQRVEVVLPKGSRVRTGLPMWHAHAMPRDVAAKEQAAAIRAWAKAAVIYADRMGGEIDDEDGSVVLNDDGEEDWIAADAARTAALEVAHKAARKDAPPRLLVRGAQGSGKSRATIAALAALQGQGLVVWLLVPTIKRADETVEEYAAAARAGSLPAMTVRGRGAASRLDPEAKMCRRHDVVLEAQKEGVDVERNICAVCPLRAGCEYQEQRARAKEMAETGGILVLANEMIYLPGSVPSAKIVVIDEAISTPVKIEKPMLGMLTEMPDVVRAQRPDLVQTLAALRMALAAGNDCARDAVRAALSKAAIRKAASDLLSMEEPPEIDGTMSDADIKKALAVGAAQRDWARGVRSVVRAVLLEYDLPGKARPSFRGLWLEAPREGMEDPTLDGMRRLHVCRLRKHRVGRKKPVLWLDGTAEPDLCRRIIPGLEDREFAIDRSGRVVQTRGQTFSRSSLTARAHGDTSKPAISDDLEARAAARRQAIRALADGKPATFLAASKSVVEMLQADGLVSEAGHFGALRGLNRWEACERAVVVGCDTPRIHDIEDEARGYSARDPLPYDSVEATWHEGLRAGLYRQTRLRRMRDGTGRPVEVLCHPDPLTDAVLRQARDAEVLQAVDRVRAVFNQRTLVLLNSLVLPFAIDEEVEADALLRAGARAAGRQVREQGLERLARVLEGADAVPLVPGEMARLWPGVWETEAAAYRWLGKQGRAPGVVADVEAGKVTHPVTKISCNGGGHLFRGVAFRPEGGRGSACVALVRVGVAAGPAIEAAMGRPVRVLGPVAQAAA